MNFIIVLLFLMFVIRGFKYKQSNILTCGQWGYIGHSFDKNSFALLGLYNQHRGVHSCGMYINNDISKGVKDERLWMDFIAKNEIPATLDENKVCLGHARQASAGYNEHGWDQQHPFTIDNIIGQQNGSITNTFDLGKKYEIEKKDWSVDTELLYTIISRTNSYDVLEEYEGSAALMWVHADTPNELYVFKGASPSNPKEKEKWYIERPLYALKEKDGIYFSSMENSLEAVRSLKGTKDDIHSVTANQVLKFKFDKNGKLKMQVIKSVVRDLTKVYHHYKQYPQHYNQGRNFMGNEQTRPKNCLTLPQGTGVVGANGLTNSIKDTITKIKPVKQPNFNDRCITPELCLDKFIHFKTGRYYCSGKLINGVFRLNEQGKVIKANKTDTEKEGKVYYFFAGVMLKDRETYTKFCKEPWSINTNVSKGKLKKHRHYFRKCAFSAYSAPSWVVNISEFAKYPVKVLEENCSDKDFVEKWYFNGKMCKGLIFRPEFCDLEYWIEDGGQLDKRPLKEGCEHGVEIPIDIRVKYKQEYPNSDPDDNFDFSNCGESCDIVEEPMVEEVERLAIWDKVFATKNDLLNELRMEDMVTLHHYVHATYNTDQPVRKDHYEVKMIVMAAIHQSIQNKESIRTTVEELNNVNLESFGLLIKQLAPKDLNLRWGVIRALYDAELAEAFMTEIQNTYANGYTKSEIENVEDENEDEDTYLSQEEEIEMTLEESLENLKDCSVTLTGVHETLKPYGNITILTELDAITVKSQKMLNEDLKEFILNNCDADGKLKR